MPYWSNSFFNYCSGVIIAIVIVVHHDVLESSKNSSYDILRGETFYGFSMIVLAPFSFIWACGLFPWWAFKTLEDIPKWNKHGLTEEEAQKRMVKLIHDVVLREQFTAGLTTLLQTMTTDAT